MKRIMIIIISILLAVSLIGCKKKDFETYKEAVKRTNEIKMGQESVKWNVSLEFNTEGMTPDEVKELNYFKNMESNLTTTFDKNQGKLISRSYFNFGGLGFDSIYYKNKEESFIKMPIVGKYLVLGDLNGGLNHRETNDDKENEFLSEETVQSIENRWIGMLKEDNVLSGKDSIFTTPDGEVKVTHYTINLAGAQIKSLIIDTIDLLSEDEKLKENINKFVKNEEEKNISSEDLFVKVKNTINQSTIDNFKYNAYIDVDGYIIHEDMEFSMKFKGQGSGKLTGLKYRLETKTWSINKGQEFTFPELTEENTLKLDEADQGVPFIFEDMLKSEK